MMKKILALLMLVLPLAATAGAPEIVKSPLDLKDYRALGLDNGLKVLLVSDPATDKSAASLDVQVGSGNDPEDWQGLAHFLEHMLFLGNQKYPEAGEYKKFIDDHGGGNNAYTTFAHTNYYFDIGADHLRPALDRFSRFFIDPTFDETFVKRERAVVHSEYQARRKDEGRRSWAARRRLINPDHPGSRFAVGSRHTLRDRGGVTARQKLIEFYRRHYSADTMTLAVVGRESLDQLEQWVNELFSGIPDRNAKAKARPFTQPYLNPQLRSSRLNMAPQKDQQRVSFLFPIASTEPHYRSKPLGYVANLLGHEGEGSLLALLESLGWAEGLSAGAGYMDKVQGTFEVSVQLTTPGLEHVDEIGSLLFQYIELIRTAGVESWRYLEAQKLAAIAFRFAEAQVAGAVARRLAAGLRRYSTEDVLRGPYMMEEYRPELITGLLARLRPDNALLQVVAKGVESDGKTPFYDVDFGIAPIPPATIARWKRGGRDERLALPAANRFIPERLTAQSSGRVPEQVLEQAPAVPERLEARHGMDIWYHGDRQFGTPRAAFYFSLKSPLGGGSARNLVLTELFVRMVNKQLDTAAYPAHLAGLHYELYRHSRGFSLRLSGYEDKQPVLLKTVLAALRAPRLEAAELALVKDELRREWKNVSLESPSNQTVHELYRLLMHPYWSEAERLAALGPISAGDLKTHAARLVEKIYITALSHGAVTRTRAVHMGAMLESAFAGSAWIDEPERNQIRVLDARAYLRSMDADHDDSALAVYFQGHGKSHPERAKMLLLARLLESPFFFNIRTTKRVGYLVHAARLDILEVPGLLFSVQSPTHTPARINRLINQFLDEFGEILARMDARDFTRVKQGLMDRILTRDKKLADRTNRYWREIDRREITFDSRRRTARLIENLGKGDILRYFQQVTKAQPRKLMVQSPGRRQGAAGGQITGAQYTPVGDSARFRKSAHLFFPAYR